MISRIDIGAISPFLKFDSTATRSCLETNNTGPGGPGITGVSRMDFVGVRKSLIKVAAPQGQALKRVVE